jgi:type II secretory pathway pseudopilin PulG
MSFRLTTLFWVFALLASAIATFGAIGIFAAALVIAFWAMRHYGNATLLELLIVVAILVVLVALLIPAVNSARESNRRAECQNQLHQIAIAIRDYDQSYDMLPPRCTVGPNHQPALSWRALILRQIELDDLANQLDYGKTWDDPTNSRVLNTDIELFHCPAWPSATPDAETNYFAVVGPRTLWREDGARKLSEIKDSPSRTIMLLEAADRNTKWMEPKDIPFDEAVDLLSHPSNRTNLHMYFSRPGFFYKIMSEPVRGLNVVMADGTAMFISVPLPRELAQALLTADGGEVIDEGLFERFVGPQIDYGRCYALGVFILLALLPAARLWRHRLRDAISAPLPLTAKDESG